MMRMTTACAISVILACVGAGCIGEPSSPAATQPVTRVDPATTQPSYWYERPSQTIEHDNFEALWAAAEDTAKDFNFKIDRTDYRAGVMTTQPLTSAQWFEPWRREVRTAEGMAESSTATIRRTIRFEFVRDGSRWSVSPKVLIERESIGEQRITSVTNYRGTFTRPVKQHDRARGTRESDAGVDLPWKYWYATGRDEVLEAALVDDLRGKLKR